MNHQCCRKELKVNLLSQCPRNTSPIQIGGAQNSLPRWSLNTVNTGVHENHWIAIMVDKHTRVEPRMKSFRERERRRDLHSSVQTLEFLKAGGEHVNTGMWLFIDVAPQQAQSQ